MACVEQDGLRTDERVAGGGWWVSLMPTAPRSRILLRTLVVADALVLVTTGCLLGVFMQAPAGLALGGGCWVLAATLLGLLRAAGRAVRRREEWVAYGISPWPVARAGPRRAGARTPVRARR
jgi:hypothetical protein